MNDTATKTTKLLPNRHPDQGFFTADIFDNLPVKDDSASMGVPMFSLSKKKDLRTVKYEKRDIKIEISPAFEHGLPTIFDKDILLYCGSLLMEQVNKGVIPPKTLRISSHDLLVATNRITTGKGYDLLEKALKRLTGVMISTNIKTDGIEQIKNFHLIESSVFIKSNFVKNRRVALEITLSDWFYNSIIGKEVLTISPQYFRLRKATERRLYELARKHCGRQPDWKIGLENLKEKVGSTGALKKFRYQIRQIAKDNYLPDYKIALTDNMVTFTNSSSTPELPLFDISDIPHIRPDTIEKGYKIVEKAGTGWDYNEIRTQFTQQLMDGKFTPENIDGAFIGFVKMKVQTKP